MCWQKTLYMLCAGQKRKSYMLCVDWKTLKIIHVMCWLENIYMVCVRWKTLYIVHVMCWLEKYIHGMCSLENIIHYTCYVLKQKHYTCYVLGKNKRKIIHVFCVDWKTFHIMLCVGEKLVLFFIIRAGCWLKNIIHYTCYVLVEIH